MQEALAEVANLISRKKLHIPIEKTYALAEAAAAQTDSQAGHTRGRRPCQRHGRSWSTRPPIDQHITASNSSRSTTPIVA